MRRCRINLPDRCQRLISRAEWHTARLKGASCESKGSRRYDKENLLWQFTVAIRSDPAGPQQQAIDNENDYWLKNEDGLLIGYDPKKYIMLLSRLQLMKKICRLVQF